MEAKFSIDAEPQSVNSWTGANKRFISAKAKEWIQTITWQCSGPLVQQQLAQIRENFNPKKHSLGISLNFIIPHGKFYNKQGLFSSRTCDVTNVEKSIVDVLFLAKYSGINYKAIGVDDKYISELHSRKSAGLTHRIEIRIWIIER